MNSKREAGLDVGHIQAREELHSALAAAFSFPDYYGKNWDAFDECLSDSNLRKIEITGISTLIDSLPRDAGLLARCLKEYGEETGAEIILK
jgi:ribonuclease inhibitor